VNAERGGPDSRLAASRKSDLNAEQPQCTAVPWWSKAPHMITPEELDRVSRAVSLAAGVLEVAAATIQEVAA
jgi:hypothetical protein